MFLVHTPISSRQKCRDKEWGRDSKMGTEHEVALWLCQDPESQVLPFLIKMDKALGSEDMGCLTGHGHGGSGWSHL